MLIDHALGSMGVSLPAAIAAKLVYPKRRVVVVTGDGGFMMNSQELETAVRLGLDLVVVVFNDSALGMIRMKQMADGYGNFGVEFKNPEMVTYAGSFGAHGHRLDDPSRFRSLLDETDRGGVHVIDIPIDAQQNMMLLKEMKSVDCLSFVGG
jgi:acetolactate synthase-1/2/3 large subunit